MTLLVQCSTLPCLFLILSNEKTLCLFSFLELNMPSLPKCPPGSRRSSLTRRCRKSKSLSKSKNLKFYCVRMNKRGTGRDGSFMGPVVKTMTKLNPRNHLYTVLAVGKCPKCGNKTYRITGSQKSKSHSKSRSHSKKRSSKKKSSRSRK